MTSRIAIVGGGPGGLFLAALLRTRRPDLEVTVFERNRRDDAFGFGVVFSDATLKAIDAADPVLRDGLRDHGEHWDRIDVRQATPEAPGGTVRHGFSGNGMAAIHRRTLLRLLQENAQRAGAELRFSTPAPDVDVLAATYDVVVGADGTNSAVRGWLADRTDLGHTVDEATAHFIWFGTTYRFDGLTFLHRASEHGHFAVHGYPISDELGTFIVETDPDTWVRAGMDRFDVTQPPGPSDLETQHYLEKLFADDIDGHGLVANNSRWGRFRTRRTATWHQQNVVLLGDAVHTAHFSVGSGTKMAMEDAVTLSEELAAADLGDAAALEAALTSYAEQRKRSVGRIQDASVPSLGWWERFGRYRDALDPLTFAFHFFSRSIGIDKIAQRDPDLARDVRAAWLAEHGAPALETTWEVGGTTLGRRLVLDGDTLLDEASGHRVPATVVAAPHDADDLPDAVETLPTGADGGPGVVAVTGGTAYTRGVLAEEARLWRGLGAVLVTPVDEAPDDAGLETLLLSARADGVATR